VTATNSVSVKKYLKGIEYPAYKEDLIEYAQEQNAEDDIIELLEQLSDEAEYNSLAEVNLALDEIE
jgi:Protein of unknown function (DUF2795)